jgi:hypothetical protein
VVWKSKKKPYGTNRDYSITRKLREENKSNEKFEIMIAAMSLEEIIALKLDLATKSIGGKMYSFPLWYSIPEICRAAVLKYILSASRTKVEAARFLGVNQEYFYRLLKKYDSESFFKEKELDK